MADIKPISDLSPASTVVAGDQFVINKAEGGSYKTSVIIPANLGPQLGPFVSLGDLSNVNTANAAVGNVLKWDGTQWSPGTGGGGSDYVLPVASDVTLGGVRIGDNIQVSSGGTGIISVANFVPADTGGIFKAGIAIEGTTSTTDLTVVSSASMNTLTMSGLITFADGQVFPGVSGQVTSVNSQIGAVVLDADDVGALPINGSTAMTGTLVSQAISASGNITTQLSITANGTVAGYGIDGTELNIQDSGTFGGNLNTDGDLTVSGSTSVAGLTATGTLNAVTAVFSGQVTVPSVPLDSVNAASKGYVDSQIINAGAGTVVSVAPGIGLNSSSALEGFTTGDPITESGTLFVRAANNTITVDSTGVSVNLTELENQLTFPVTSVNSQTGAVNLTAANVDAVSATTGGTFGGSVTVNGDVTATKFYGDGSELTGINTSSPIIYRGTTDCVNDTAPTDPASGDLYINLVSGTADSSWTGLTTVIADQFVVYKGDTWETGSVLDGSTFVTLSTNQTITGTKIFSAQTTTFTDVSAADVTASGDVGITGALTGTTATFSGLVSGVDPTTSANFTTKNYVDSAITAAGGGTVTSINNIDPDPQGDVTLTPADVSAWNSNGDTTFANPCDVYTGPLSGNALRFYGGILGSNPTLAFRIMTGSGAEEVEFSYPIESREDLLLRKDLNFTQSGKHITFLDGQGNALEFAADVGDGTTDEYMRFNTGGVDQVMFFKQLTATTNNGISFKELMPVAGSHINLQGGDSDALDIVDQSADIYQRFNTAAERIEFQKDVTASTLGSTTVNVTNINLASNTGTPVAGDINLLDNSNQALDIKDNEGKIYIRLRTTTDDEKVQIQQTLDIDSSTTITTDGIVTVQKSVNIGVDADLEDGIILDTITDGGNQGGRITAYVNQSSVGNKLNIFHVLNGDPTDSSNNVDYIQMTANGDATFAGDVTADKYYGDGSHLTGVTSVPVQISATAPSSSPEPGELWWDSTDGILYVYYTDEDTDSQWVDVRPGAGEIGEVTTALRALKSAAASATTLATLKGAIATALANI